MNGGNVSGIATSSQRKYGPLSIMDQEEFYLFVSLNIQKRNNMSDQEQNLVICLEKKKLSENHKTLVAARLCLRKWTQTFIDRTMDVCVHTDVRDNIYLMFEVDSQHAEV